MASIATCFSVKAKSHHYPHYTFSLKPSLLSKSPYSHSPSFTTSIHLRNALKPRHPSVSLSIKASIDIPAGIKPGNQIETDRLPTDVRKRAMDAVDSFGGRVTIGDVSSKAGLKVNESQKALQALAADTGGFLEVPNLVKWGLQIVRPMKKRLWKYVLPGKLPTRKVSQLRNLVRITSSLGSNFKQIDQISNFIFPLQVFKKFSYLAAISTESALKDSCTSHV